MEEESGEERYREEERKKLIVFSFLNCSLVFKTCFGNAKKKKKSCCYTQRLIWIALIWTETERKEEREWEACERKKKKQMHGEREENRLRQTEMLLDGTLDQFTPLSQDTQTLADPPLTQHRKKDITHRHYTKTLHKDITQRQKHIHTKETEPLNTDRKSTGGNKLNTRRD